MFKSVEAKNVNEYIAMVPDERREIMKFMHDFIQKSAPSLKQHFANNMLGYGKFKYKDYKKRDIEWPVVALANQKQYVSLYICALLDGEYIAESYGKKLGNVSTGKSCIRFKKLEDLNLDAVKEILELAAANPGLDISK